MRRFTTPTVELTVKGVDLTGYSVYVTFAQTGNVLTIDDATVALVGTDTSIAIPLSQLQTGGMREGTVEVQVNWLDGNGQRDATTIGSIDIERNLLAKVVEDA